MRPTELTQGELLELRRRRAGLTQPKTAELLGVVVSRYRLMERNPDPTYPNATIVDLGAPEWCWLARKRAGITLTRCEELSGFQRQWIHSVERGTSKNTSPLVTWWAARSEA